MKSAAFFESSHGFGHAARAAAIMAALSEKDDSLRWEIFSQTPRWFFEDSLQKPFGYHEILTDVGFVQLNPFQEDLQSTLRSLGRFFPLKNSMVDVLSKKIKTLGCRLVICDIAPLGIAVARNAGVRSVLVENFTWDWIYAAYAGMGNGIGFYVKYLRDLFLAVDFHIQTRPVCLPDPSAHLLVGPVARRSKMQPDDVRRSLKIAKGCKMITITAGGIKNSYGFIEKLERVKNVHFVIAGDHSRLDAPSNVSLFPQRGPFYHPDLIKASDVVVGKAGYSTTAEVYVSGIPFAFVSRERFPESPVLAAFIEEEMNGLPIEQEKFLGGEWIARLPELLSMKKKKNPRQNGANIIADYLTGLF